MKAQFTAGPWNVLKDSPPGVRAANGDNVAPEVCTLADAALIASAPDLLAALEGAQKALRKALPFVPADKEAHFVGEWLDAVNAAINKAKGQ